MSTLIPDHLVEEIKNRTNIVDIISRFVDLKRTGSNFKGLCPFHSEKTPSFVVSEEKQIFHCFGCGVGGNAFTFLMKNEGKSFPEILRELAKESGVVIPESFNRDKDSSVKDNRESILRVNKFAARFFHQTLLSNLGIEARRYLTRRGISEEMIELFRIGYAPDSWDVMQRALQGSGVPAPLMFEAGLVVQRKNQDGFYDRFRDRIIFPVLNTKSQFVGFGGRAISDQNEPKYLNSPETVCYQKSKILFGLLNAKQEIRLLDEVLIVEGYLDQISLYQNGIKNVVATMGTALTDEHLKLLEKHTKNLFLVYDGDEAGKQAAVRGAKLTIRMGIGCRVVLLPKGEDPDSYIRSNGPKLFRELVKGGRNALEFLIEEILRGTDRGAQVRMRVVEDIAPILASLQNVVAQELYSKELAERLGISVSLIDSIINSKNNQIQDQTLSTNKQAQLDPRSNQDRSEWLILEQIVQHANLSQRLIDEDAINLIENEAIKEILEWIISNYKVKKRWTENDLLSRISDSKLHSRLSAVLISEPSLEEDDALRVVSDCIKTLKFQQLLFLERDLLAKIKEYDRKGDVERASEALRTYQELVRSQKQRYENPAERVTHGKSA